MIKSVFAALCALNLAAATLAPNARAEQTASGNTPSLITIRSENDFGATLEKTQTAIEARGFKTFAVIDHAAGAASAGMSLRPTTLIIFGNPEGGAPVMQAAQSMGLALPLKILVLEEDEGAVHIMHADMSDVFSRHGLADLSGPQANMNAALRAIAAEAAGTASE